MTHRAAVVDIGTNSVRLLVAELDRHGDVVTLARPMRITRLGQGVDESGALASEAIDRTAAAVADFAAIWQDLDVQRVSVTATAAARDATNTAALAERLQAAAAVQLRVLSGSEEAAYSFSGAISVVAKAGAQVAVIDIGGGSTEVIRGARKPGAHVSLQLGSVRLTERLLQGDPPTAAQVAAATEEARTQLTRAVHHVDPRKATFFVGVAGTVTTLAALQLGLDRYLPGRIHGTVMTREDVTELTDRLLTLSTAGRAALGPMDPGRADVIAGGAIILREALEMFEFREVVTSESDILDGLARELLTG